MNAPHPVRVIQPTPDAEPLGVQAGMQATVDWPAAAAGVQPPKEQQAIDLQDHRGLGVWRVSAIARVPGERIFGRLIYGTSSTFELQNVVLPLVAYIPGNAQLYLLPETTAPAERLSVRVSAKLVGGFSQPQVVRTFHDTAGVLPPSGYRFTALAAATLTVQGVAGIAVAAGDSLRITAPSTLTAGSGLVEHEL